MSDPVAFLTIVEVDPARHQEIIDLLLEGTETVMVTRPGVISVTWSGSSPRHHNGNGGQRASQPRTARHCSSSRGRGFVQSLSRSRRSRSGAAIDTGADDEVVDTEDVHFLPPWTWAVSSARTSVGR